MPRRHPNQTTALRLLAAALLLSGCSANRNGIITAAPTVRATGTTAVRTVTAPAVTTQTTSGAKTGGSFITQLGATAPAYAPNGNSLAFTTPSRGVLLSGSDGSNARSLSGSLPGDHDPAWSQAGDSVALVRATTGGQAIVRIDVASGMTTTLFQGGTLHSPTWLPNNAGVVFVRDQGTLMRWDASSNQATVIWQGVLAASPTVSADGRVVFQAQSASGASGLASIPLGGGNATAVAVVGQHPRQPAFSSTGRSLAYVADDGVYVASADGSNAQRVASGTGFDAPTWAPGQPELVVQATVGSRTDLEKVSLPAR